MNPNELRTKWASLAGVKYPEQRRAEKRADEADEEAFKGPDPEIWISTPDAAKLLGYCYSGVCSVLSRRGLEKALVTIDGQRRAYYLRADIEAIKKQNDERKKMTTQQKKQIRDLSYRLRSLAPNLEKIMPTLPEYARRKLFAEIATAAKHLAKIYGQATEKQQP